MRGCSSMRARLDAPGYVGSKGGAGVYQAIIALFPPHDTYIETHLGSGQVFQKKPPAMRSIGIEVDPVVIRDYWRSPSMIDGDDSAPGGIDIYNTRAESFLAEYDFTGRELVYCDPPYMLAARTGKYRYRFDYSVPDHERLLQQLVNLPCSVVVSGYPTRLYDEILHSWNTIEFQAMTRGGVRTEKVWFNYEISRAYCPDYAGLNFTDRQRIKRKAQRWATNYAAMPAGERLAVLSAMLATEASE